MFSRFLLSLSLFLIFTNAIEHPSHGAQNGAILDDRDLRVCVCVDTYVCVNIPVWCVYIHTMIIIKKHQKNMYI